MERRVLWIYAVVLTAALVAAFVQETGFAAVEPGQLVVLTLDVVLVWVFAGLAVKARIFEVGRETVRDAAQAGARSRAAAPADSLDTGIFVRPNVGRL